MLIWNRLLICVDYTSRCCKNFNPHFRKGSDDSWSLRQYVHEISIHTSAREVTKVIYRCPYLSDHFNPHFRKGSDDGRSAAVKQYGKFQSTLPQGKWHSPKNTLLLYAQFQSTLPQGKWLQYSTKTSVYFYEISINIFEFTFVYYWNTLSIQKAHSNLFIFTGASLPVILCMLDTRTCKL